MIDLTDLLNDDDEPILHPREIFLTLDRDSGFQFPRDIQTEVMNAWYETRDQRDTIIKLNVGGGKTLLGLLLLQSSLNEGISPALYVCPDKQLVNQVLEEAGALGIDATDDPKDSAFQAGQRICVTNVYRVFNGKSVFGVGAEGQKIPLGAVVVDDAHACLATVNEQFKVSLPNSHPAYQKIFKIAAEDLKGQSAGLFLELKNGDPRAILEVPFWVWKEKNDAILEALYEARDSEELQFSYQLLRDTLPFCRCIISGQKLEIEPIFPPTDLVRSFDRAERRIFMTATLSDDSVLVTHFGASPDHLKEPLVPKSSQSMGERMILVPQDTNPDLEFEQMRDLLVSFAKDENVVIIVPSDKAAKIWEEHADQVLKTGDIVAGVEKLREGHVGLTVLINRYDGIDLPGDACRVLALIDLPEISSFRELSDQAVLSNTDIILERQVQRIEQGMGRGVRSNDDYCVVFLWGAKLTQRIKSSKGQSMLTPATKAQMDLSAKLTKKLAGASMNDIENVALQCLDRDKTWTKISKQTLLKVKADDGLRLDETTLSVKHAFDLARQDDPINAETVLTKTINAIDDRDLKAWLKARVAEIKQVTDPAEAQKILASAHRLNPGVLKPVKGATYQKLSPPASKQASRVQEYHRSRFLDSAQRVLEAKSIVSDLEFDPDETNKFESALELLGTMIGLAAQRPEKTQGEGPDCLWAYRDPHYLVIEAKSGATSKQGISKDDLGQLEQSMSWFEKKYGDIAPGTPVMVHPLKNVGPGGTAIAGMRIVTEGKMKALTKAFTSFCVSLGDENILNDVKRIANLLTEHNLTRSAFLATFTTKPKQ